MTSPSSRLRCLLSLVVLSCSHSTGFASQETASSHGASSPVDAPLSLAFGTWGVVPVHVGTLRANYVVDTGTNRTLVDLETARQQGWALSNCQAISGSLVPELCSVSLPSVEVASRQLALPRGFAADMRHSSLAQFTGTSGILGADVLSRFVLVIDYPRSRWSLMEPADFRPPAYPPIPIELEGDIVLVPAHVQGQPVRLLLDTGNSGDTILLDVSGQENLVSEAGRALSTVVNSGAGGSITLAPGRADLAVGDFRWSRAPVSVASSASRTTPVMLTHQGILGVGFLRHFRVTIDYPHRRLYLEQELPWGTDAHVATLGMQVRPDGDKLLVGEIATRGPAALAGVSPGDEIVAVDGFAVAGRSNVLWPLLMWPSTGQSCELLLRSAGAAPRQVILKSIARP